ncbi:acyl CoA:acetate/3-ketoacid CoA transferase [Azospirillum soli]|uniref:acyl CoA:acetate/3-ketoacid CoA transferase n=1 Tax=Azospirillum soli TaxID=1304799 RepID=UPI001AE3E2B1|nr:malonate decarboxylase subunit alpha [Azospirillum soli]MBP2315699.1 propionate CoA-transferase [Azospirillum soli]
MKIVTAAEAARAVQDGWTVTTGGFGSCGHPEAVTAALADRYRADRHPRDLTLLFAAGQGDRGERGLNRLADPGLIRRVIGGFWGLAPALGALAMRNEIEAHNWPQGVVSHLFRAVAGGQPGVITKVGLNTVIDPDQEGGCLNGRTAQSLIRKIHIDGEPYLHYPRLGIDCAILRGSQADTRGNITMDREVSFSDSLAQAQAARNSGGIVIVQVAEVVPAGTLPPQQVRIPGILVDYLVVADEPEHHAQTYGEGLNPLYTTAGAASPAEARTDQPANGLRRLIARRAAEELRRHRDPVVNLGIGIPAEIGAAAAAAGLDRFTLTVESGMIGGTPASGLSFGASALPQAVIEQAALFDFYDGGGIDIAFLGFAQVDGQGNVNVSRFRGGLPGVGGFVNISQSARQLVFCGTFTADGLEVEVGGGRLAIRREGQVQKFVPTVDQISFSGPYACAQGRPVTFVTERAVFTLVDGVLHLIEVAPGIDLHRDILERTDIPLVVAFDYRTMDPALFQ